MQHLFVKRKCQKVDVHNLIGYCDKVKYHGILFLRAFTLSRCSADPPKPEPISGVNGKADAFYYLSSFGYIEANKNEGMASLLSDSSSLITAAIEDFQKFAGLKVTGELDRETLKMMNTPRCGLKDKLGPSTRARRKKRYALQGSKWSKRELTYSITKYPSRLKKRDVDDKIKTALGLWEDVTDLTIQHKGSGSVHIEIRFERGEHGDGEPFDGPVGTLAHAFFPEFGGDAHFDDDEYWTIDDYRGTNLLQTAAHEFGHSLGLSHSQDSSALMFPFYRGYQPNLKLEADDIRGIQALYGRKGSGGGPRPTGKPNVPSVPDSPDDDSDNGDNTDLCEGKGYIDTIFSNADGDFFVFKGRHYYKLTDDSIADGYPRKISVDWPGLPDNVDAAVSWENGYTYFFKGSKYYRFDVDRNPSRGFPKDISEGFPGIPNNVDAAFAWGGNGKMYFFKGDKYWMFDPGQRFNPVQDDYPRNIDNWGLPRGISGAVRWKNNRSYFFHRGEYYRFNDRRFEIDDGGRFKFPRPSGPWWFGCDDDNYKTSALKKEDTIALLKDGFTEVDDIILDHDK